MRKMVALPAFCVLLYCPVYSQVSVWQKWTQELTSTKEYENPYRDVSVKAVFTGPDHTTQEVFGYWAGEQTYAVSFCFPKSGKWSWTVSCSDSTNEGLYAGSGVVDVRDYDGPNPLYANGFLKVSENKRHLSYDNGKPFLWMGCTAWFAPSNATLDEWKAYIDDRARKHFTVVQISPFFRGGDHNDPQATAQANVSGELPFTAYYNRLNPAFWKDLAERVDYANAKGLMVVVVGLPGWQFYLNDPVERRVFSQYITGLFGGNFVIYSPSSDRPYSVESDQLAMSIDSIDSRHLITQHPNTPTGRPVNTASEAYFDRPYLDFSMCQSGHNGGNRSRCVWNAIHWNLSLYGRKPPKPVINTEAFYHGNPEANDARNRGTDTDARSLGWYSWLSGSLGYTYGAMGIWNWGIRRAGILVPWEEAIRLNSSFQMQYMADFLTEINWWELEPHPQAIVGQPQDTLRLAAFAKNKEGTLAVAYLPEDSKVVIDMGVFKGKVKTSWFDPRLNTYTAGPEPADNRKAFTFIPPGNGDWVLKMTCLP